MSLFEMLKANAPPAPTEPPRPRFSEPGVRPYPDQIPAEVTHPVWEGRRRPPVEDSEELQRILALPRRPPVDLDHPTPELERLVDEETARYARHNPACTCPVVGGRKRCITRLMPVQAWALREMRETGGLLGNIVVGGGKTLLDILAALAVPDVKLAVLFVPPNLQDQLGRSYDAISQHFRVPTLMLKNGMREVRGAPVLYVIPYSRFSRPESTVLLESLRPDLVIADEGHSLKNPDAARTIRAMRYFKSHPETRFCVWSGTLTDKSLKDYYHLSGVALKKGSPLPLSATITEAWSLAIDPIEWKADPGALYQMCRHGETIYDGFRRRLSETPGVVTTTGASIGTSLVIEEHPAPTIPPHVLEALRETRAKMVRPDGEELTDAMQVAAVARQLACGFYYRWRFPHGHVDSQGCVCVKGSKELCTPCTETVVRWFARRKAWNAELRDKLAEHREHLDSKMLCENAAERAWAHVLTGEAYTGDLPTWRAQAYLPWREIRDKVRPVPETIWLDEYLAQATAEWAKKNKAIVWVQHQGFGQKVAKLAGLPFYSGLAGSPVLVEKLPDETYKWNEDGSRSVILSIKQYGMGTDGLQHRFSDQLVASPPSSAQWWEQLLGRLHRPGQDADTVTTRVYRHTPEMADAIDTAVLRARYVYKTTRSYQKLLSATVAFDLPEDDDR